jgi:hypothetical protein
VRPIFSSSLHFSLPPRTARMLFLTLVPTSQGDPSMNPDRISDYSRGTRQQDAYYDTSGWTASLDGKGLKRGAGGAGAVEDDGPRKKKPSAKEVEKFRQKKVDKKRAKLMDFLK